MRMIHATPTLNLIKMYDLTVGKADLGSQKLGTQISQELQKRGFYVTPTNSKGLAHLADLPKNGAHY